MRTNNAPSLTEVADRSASSVTDAITPLTAMLAERHIGHIAAL